MNWYIKCLKQYIDFSGRARRKEFWMFVLFNAIISVVLTIIDAAIGLSDNKLGVGVLSSIYSLAVLIPSLAVSVRRLHDIGKSGWSFLISIIPLVGPIVMLIWFCKAGEQSSNEYGDNPKIVQESSMNPDVEDVENESNKSSKLLLIWIIANTIFGIISYAYVHLVHNWYDKSEYFTILIISNLLNILPALAIKNRKYRTIGIIIMSCLIIWRHIQYIY